MPAVAVFTVLVAMSAPAFAHVGASAPKPSEDAPAAKRIVIDTAPRARVRSAVARAERAKTDVKMTTVLRCRDGVCMRVSTKTAVSGSELVTDD